MYGSDGSKLLNKTTKRMKIRMKRGRSDKPQQGRRNTNQGRRNKKQKPRLSGLQLEHMDSWNEQNEVQQATGLQLNRGTQQSEENRLQHQEKNRGLSEEQLNLIPKFIADESSTEDECPICLEKFKKNQKLLKLYCDHLLHNEFCIKWLENKKTCPICRDDQSKYHRFL